MSSNSRLILPVALGLSIVTVTAFVVYYVFKKDEENEAGGTIKSSKMNIIEIKVSKSIVPALIGRNGSNIKDIEKKTGALINFKKFTDSDHDVCMIRGRAQATQLAEMLVLEFIKQQPELFDESFTVPSWAIGRIIGSGGSNINEISHRSGARVKVEGLATDKTSERVINIRGTKEQIEQAKKHVESHVAQEKCRREIEQTKSPRHASPPAAPAPATPAPGAEGGRARSEPPDETGDRPHAKYKRHESSAPSIEVYVSAVSSPSRFWVQFVGPQVAQLDELVTHMTDYYSNKENRTAHALKHVSVGQVVAAVFRHDGKWYRARVHDIRPNEFDATQEVADVFFLDYGDSEYVATHELCELRADLLRLRFQAMECFLAGVRPADSPDGENRWDKWSAPAVERFEELAQVARWKPLVSRTCTYKKTPSAEGEKEKEIPGIKLYEVTDEGELDIGAVLIEEGFAVEGVHTEHAHAAPGTPFGDLGNSRVLGMLTGGARSSSLPKDHKDDRSEQVLKKKDEFTKEAEVMLASKSLAAGLEYTDKPLSISNLDVTEKPHVNGSSDFLSAERQSLDTQNASTETLTPKPEGLTKVQREECKANMNRIDSHHSNLEALGRTHEMH